MRRRSGTLDEMNIERASLVDINGAIADMEWRALSAPLNNQLRKEALQRLIGLEAARERLFAIPAPPRRGFPAR